MKKKTLALTLLAVLAVAPYAHALEIKVVSNYGSAASPEIWKKSKADQVPEALMSRQSVAKPSGSYSSLFPKTFLQEDMFAVCYQDCSKESFKEKNGEISNTDKWDTIEQANVYYWINRYFSFLDKELMYKPQMFLKVMTNRNIKEEGKKLKNNAFFNPADTSLSFLPASKNLLFKLMNGKINRSGYDASVIAHEASHYLFQHLYSNSVNDEIGGLNEGFADYIANIFIKDPKVGLVMLQGKALRDSSSLMASDNSIKTYKPGMEVHDLGELVAFALWSTRSLADNKGEFDRMVIDAVADLGANPYGTIHDFKDKMVERLPQVIPSGSMSTALNVWEMVFPGKSAKIDNLSFLNTPIPNGSFIGYSIKQIMPEESAREMGVPSENKLNFSLIATKKISDSQLAILASTETNTLATPYWIVVDAKRMNILGIYTIDHELVTDEKELEIAQKVATQVIGSVEFTKDFSARLKAFKDLSDGKGEFAAGYKVQSKMITPNSIMFNGVPTQAVKMEINLKRKLLVGFLFGLPEIQKITLHAVAIPGITNIDIEGHSVIGYTLQLKSGTTMEVIMDKIAL